jgi:hypothetical protein
MWYLHWFFLPQRFFIHNSFFLLSPPSVQDSRLADVITAYLEGTELILTTVDCWVTRLHPNREYAWGVRGGFCARQKIAASNIDILLQELLLVFSFLLSYFT